jgi:glycerol-3-phosphate dehydrogenase
LKRDLSRIAGETFDLIIIGGGIVGAGIARDAALRGLHILLVEKEDFACGTTSRSTRLIHGGLRYLRFFQFGLVRQDLREREILLRIAPHLVHRIRFVIPLLSSEPFYRITLPLGLFLYDILAWDKKVPHWERLSRAKTLAMEPALTGIFGLTGSCLYYDGQAVEMERLCLENLVAAADQGACIVNHAAASGLLVREGKVTGLEIKDTLTEQTYTAKSGIVINATGHWADLVWQNLRVKSSATLRKTKGVHLFTRKISDNALVLFAKSDGRLFFVIPWGDYSLIGTTDTDYNGDPDAVFADTADVNYLVTEMHHYFPDFGPDDIYYTMAGLRPLVAAQKKAASNTSRAHKLLDHGKIEGPEGLITVMGGKITAYRAIAEETIDLVCKKKGQSIKCATASTPLPGGAASQPEKSRRLAAEIGLTADIEAHLTSIYGSRTTNILDLVSADKQLGQPLAAGSKEILAQIKYAVEEEEALTVSDYLLRRSDAGLGPSQGLDVLDTVVQEMGNLLGWSENERQVQAESYRRQVANGQLFRSNL